MKKFLFLAILVTFTIIFNACSATGEQVNSTNSAANTATVNSANQTTRNAPANMVVVSEAEKKSREVFNNGANPNTQNVVGNPDNTQSKDYKEGRPAPDDSTFQSAMNAKGQPVETRTFKNHPQLAKVERVFITPNQKKFFVYLKNGKVVEVADDKLPTFQTTVPGTILAAAGVELIINPSDPKNGEKKNQQTPSN